MVFLHPFAVVICVVVGCRWPVYLLFKGVKTAFSSPGILAFTWGGNALHIFNLQEKKTEKLTNQTPVCTVVAIAFATEAADSGYILVRS